MPQGIKEAVGGEAGFWDGLLKMPIVEVLHAAVCEAHVASLMMTIFRPAGDLIGGDFGEAIF